MQDEAEFILDRIDDVDRGKLALERCTRGD